MERHEIQEALNLFDNNRTRAAEYLGISRRTLQTKIKKYGL
ncbi:MAG: helix-turn-helix domain-containing protein [Bacillota bacterium]